MKTNIDILNTYKTYVCIIKHTTTVIPQYVNLANFYRFNSTLKEQSDRVEALQI